ncbi:ATP-dependent RNA helicase ddx24 [Anoplophora glabripennis]|uniref:ATP-dependent RNA helicase ddx24 n=1 Tax=Anoplophora glabripennis TaxID=217634 RepID=UPI000873A3FE|nr:ATP-dependent RNA helicase ddx24 [Anoplophora glabripennis]
MAAIKSNWKPVEIDSCVLTGGVDGLIGIEVCTDYDANNFQFIKKSKHKLSKNDKSPIKKKKKRVKETPEENFNTQEGKQDIFSPSKFGNTSRMIEENSASQSDQTDLNLEAWNSFNLPQSLLDALKDMNFTQPTQIQALTLPAALLGRRDILGAAETGSGKTLAFGLPILSGILKVKEQAETFDQTEQDSSDSEESEFEIDGNEIDEKGMGCIKSVNINVKEQSVKPLYALILTPTRELAMQIKNHLTVVAKYTGINITVVVGGMAAVKQERILSKGPEIVVATPGRLWELVQQGNPHLSQIDNIRFLAIDETDRMLERGHFQELHDLLERINFDEIKKKQRQNFVFSATLTLVHELPRHLKNKSKLTKSKKIHDMTPEQKLKKIVEMLGITEPKVVDITQGTGTSGTLTECKITCGIEEKDYYVYYFLKRHPGRTLIFCNSIGCVKRLSTLLTLLECHPLPLHASMQQRQRLKNLERFRDTEDSILVATDVAARGLDIPFVENVLHYQTPRTSESYVHRSGRTARASRQGITILLIEPNEVQSYLRLCKTLQKDEDLPTFPIQDQYLKAVKDRVNLARELDKLQLQVRKANSEAGWFQKAAEEMDIIVDDSARKYDTKEAEQGKKLADLKRKQLISLLATPIFPKGFSGKYPLLSEELPNIFTRNEFREEKAIDAMKNAIEINAKEKKRTVPLYKQKKGAAVKRSNAVTIKLSKNVKGKDELKKSRFRKKGRRKSH